MRTTQTLDNASDRSRGHTPMRSGGCRSRTAGRARSPPRCSPARSARSTAEAGGGADRDDHADPGGHRLLHDLEADPAADAEHRRRRAPAPAQQPLADGLVHRVVPADVLADHDRGRRRRSNRPAACTPPVLSKTRCRSRSRSGSARTTSAATRRSDQRPSPAGRGRTGTGEHVVDALGAADPARRRSRLRDRRTGRWGCGAGAAPASTVTTLNSCAGVERIVSAIRNRMDVTIGHGTPSREQEAGGELEVVAGGAHRDRDPLRGATRARPAGSRAAPRSRAGPRGAGRRSSL